MFDPLPNRCHFGRAGAGGMADQTYKPINPYLVSGTSSPIRIFWIGPGFSSPPCYISRRPLLRSCKTSEEMSMTCSRICIPFRPTMGEKPMLLAQPSVVGFHVYGRS
jgi:hypothetical protein